MYHVNQFLSACSVRVEHSAQGPTRAKWVVREGLGRKGEEGLDLKDNLVG